ncbi:hypothetical protein L218DRAFT_959752 [Marasmius fiardii PR-910]|nr:hypothetical protein L218DRAFT_959752 [Marasmius fiardii PR-910]
MDSPSWKDAISAAVGSCLPCFTSSNDAETEPLPNSSSSRSRPPQHLEALLADPHDTDTEAETVSLHSNIGAGSGTLRGRKKNKKKRNQGGGITLFGLNLFGRRTGAIHLPEDDDEVDRLLHRNQGSYNRRVRRTSSTSTAPSSSLTFDPDASPLDPASIDQLTPAQLEERARQAVLEAEEERRAKEERKRIRREKKELKKLAAQLAVSGPGDEGDFEGFQGSGGLRPTVGAGAGSNINTDYSFIPSTLLNPDTLGTRSMDDEADGSADLDGTLYTGRSRAGGASVSGGGSDSQRSPASGSVASYQEYHQFQHPNVVNLTPSTTPTVKKKKKSSNKSKSSRSHSSATSSTQSPSLASPVGTEFMGLPSSASPLDDFRLPNKPSLVIGDSYSVKERGFPGLGGLTRAGRNGAFLASRGDEA